MQIYSNANETEKNKICLDANNCGPSTSERFASLLIDVNYRQFDEFDSLLLFSVSFVTVSRLCLCASCGTHRYHIDRVLSHIKR